MSVDQAAQQQQMVPVAPDEPHPARPGLAARALAFARRSGLNGRAAVIAVPNVWLLLFFLIPFGIVLKISFSEMQTGIPPYAPLVEVVDGAMLHVRLNLANFGTLLGDELYVDAYLNSLEVAAISTICCLLLGYPMAYAIARAPSATRNVLLLLIMLPFWTSFLLRVYAWMGMLEDEGFINQVLMAAGLIDEPLTMLHTNFAVYLGIVYSYLPFMILPLYATLEKMDGSLLEAAADLGCKPFRAFLSVTLPLSMPGIVAGSILVFVPAVGEFVIPDLLGGPDSLMIGRVLWNDFFNNRDWPLASAVAVALLLLVVAPVMLFQRAHNKGLEEES